MDTKDIRVDYDAERSAWKGFFEHKGRYYVADLAVVHDYHRPEVMIFAAQKNGEVSSYLDLYAAYPERVDRETLIQHIQLFTAEQKNIKTLKGWNESNARTWGEYCKPMDEIDEEAYNYFLNVMPPRTLRHGYFQVGEPYSHCKDANGNWKAVWPTFCKGQNADGSRKYVYLGNCFAGAWKNVP